MENARELIRGNFLHHYRAFRERLEDNGGVAPVEWTPDLLREKGVHSAKNETTVRAGVPASNS